MKEAAAEVERKRQKELEKQRSTYLTLFYICKFICNGIVVLKKQEEIEEERKQEEAKKQRAEEKKRRKEEFEKLQALKQTQENIDDEEEEGKKHINYDMIGFYLHNYYRGC